MGMDTSSKFVFYHSDMGPTNILVDPAMQPIQQFYAHRFHNNLTHRHPDFDSRDYGYSKFCDLITATSWFDIRRESNGGPIYIRAKGQTHATSN
ncbi:hypothetical protein QBC43DRAFT_284724 [Cladorrhinum sp. PSN259]|nr:hypothetical protein QBC43DRAFT_284724 [Cladorrhinum sp. PSN259]